MFVDKQKQLDRDDVIHELIDIQYDRNDYELKRGTFRVRGDALDVFPPYADNPVRIEFWGDEIEGITEIDNVTGEVLNEFEALPIWPASHYVAARPKMDRALSKPSATSCANACSSSRRRASCSRRSVWRCARTTIWR